MLTAKSSAPTGGLRRNILLAVLALLTVGLIYDFAVARPAVEQAYTTLAEKNAEFNAARKHEAMGEADVWDLLGREPSRSFQDGTVHVEVYSWRAGLPWRTHDLFVVYRTVLGERFVARLTKFGHELEEGFQADPGLRPTDVELAMPDFDPPAADPRSGGVTEPESGVEPDEASAESDAAQPAPDSAGVENADEPADTTSPADPPENGVPAQDPEQPAA